MLRLTRFSEIASAVALVFSIYNFWQNSQKPPEMRLFVPPVINYASVNPNNNFEMFAIPLTVINQGARTGTILSMDLVVKNLETNETKRFFSASLGKWSVTKDRADGFESFAPISLAGRASYSETVQFYTRGDEKVLQIVQNPGRYQFTVTVDSPEADFGFLDQALSKGTQPLTFEMVLQQQKDYRAFNQGSGTIWLHNKDWQSSASL
jgi:hypothetical protein